MLPAGGRDVGFGRLLIATGVRARPWPDPAEAARDGVFVLRGRADAALLRKRLRDGAGRVLVIGAGFTGSEIASACRELGLGRDRRGTGPGALVGALGEVIGSIAGDLQREHGADLRCGVTVTALEGDGGGRTALGITGPPQDGVWPRLWWSPTGPLNSLPLHAAGHHTVAGASVLDRAVSSYTPTVRALLHSRARPVPARRAGLTVAMPATPGHAALPETAREAVEVTARIQGQVLVGPRASRAAVLAALPGASVAHFACHAGSDPYDPSASHLLLHDGTLSVTEISRLHLDDAELAYLSACATARGGARLADEAMHLASAFQLAGYAQAVATLWEIGDHTAATMAADFHRELGGALGDPARIPGALALHTATRRMRAAMPGRPSAWAAFLHSGA
ncbi:CHAT domain-containing protein [Nonomuraea sp. B12E4]|uniref:CHAT domain-containing protein n=1 Tax=Nonomuraea sp. B12E4 TaxID=3153564 RepID=UPI00325EEB31